MIRFGIVGTGRISDWVLKGAVQDPRFKAVAVCSRSEANARRFIAEHQEAFAQDALIFTSIEEMASCPGIDAVYIGTPNKTHCQFSISCLKQGKGVLCEKPLACNASEVEQMIEASRQYNATLMEAMVSTLNPNFLKAREALSEIAPIRQYSSNYLQYSSKYEDLKKGIVANSFNPAMGGGAIEDVGIYTVYPAAVLFGKPQDISSNMLTMPSPVGDIEVQGNIELKYPGMSAHLCYSKIVDSSLPTEICGEGGNLLLDQIHVCRKVELTPHTAPTSGRGPAAEKEVLSEGHEKDTYFYEFKEFIDLMESGKIESEVNSHAASLLTRQIMDKAKENL